MKLSEAIRLGAMLKPRSERGFGEGKTSCAITAASDAIGAEHWVRVYDEWPWLESTASEELVPQEMRHFVASQQRYPAEYKHVIWLLHDNYHWTREQIADWVETIEAQQEQTPEPQPVSVEA